MEIDNQTLKNKISESQLCQRNWDLSKEIPQEHIDILVHAVTQCPSKQNISHYSVKFITNREIIEQIHENSWAPVPTNSPFPSRTNPQVLASLLVLFEKKSLKDIVVEGHNDIYNTDHNKEFGFDETEIYNRDSATSVGIAAGYLNLTAHLLGYKTGFCACFDNEPVKGLLNSTYEPMVFLGIGYPNSDIDRRIHHTTNRTLTAFPKQPIDYTFIK